MKAPTLILLFLSSVCTFAQNKISIDTIDVRYQIQGIVDITSHIPQVRGGANVKVLEMINTDIKSYFMASIPKDSAQYVQDLLLEFGLHSLDEYVNNYDTLGLGQDDESEGFEFTYTSDSLLNFTYRYYFYPYGGRPQFSFESVIYDLRTGQTLLFDDFFTIEKDTLIELLRTKGYFISEQSDANTPAVLVPIDEYDDYVETNIEHLFIEDGYCIDYYFKESGEEVHLICVFECAGPYPLEYGLHLDYLKPWRQAAGLRR